MYKALPDTTNAWMAQDSSYGLSPVAILADSDPLESGSNFPHEHFLRMRILYVTEVLLPRNAIRRRFLARFHEEVKDKVKVTFDRNRSLEYLEGFLENPAKIEAAWLSQDPEKAGFFAIAIDELHQLNAKGVETTSDDEDTSGEKVFPGPFRIKPPGETGESPAVALARAKWNMTTPSKQHHSNVPNYLQHTTELEPEGLSSFDDESTQATPSTEVRSEHSALDSTIARAKNAFDRKNYIPKDEQIVNVCLETMLIALSWTLGYRNRISAERRAFHIPKDDTSHLYQAQVDGLIKGDGVRIPIAFMEVKKHLRGTNQAVRRQIGAQMSGFIYAHDKDLPASTTEDNRSMWMVSMDGYEAYINIALYDSKHVDFLSSTPSSRGYAGFMHLIERGPYDLRRWEPDGLGSFLTDVAILMGGPKATLELKFPELKVK